MPERLVAGVFVVAIWWLSTGIVLKVVWLDRSLVRPSVTIATVVAAVAACGLLWTRDYTSPGAAYLAFTCAVVIWGWHELTFLLGIITGPRKVPCPPNALGWERFRVAPGPATAPGTAFRHR